MRMLPKQSACKKKNDIREVPMKVYKCFAIPWNLHHLSIVSIFSRIVLLNLQIFESSKDFVHHARRSLGNCLAQLGPRIAEKWVFDKKCFALSGCMKLCKWHPTSHNSCVQWKPIDAYPRSVRNNSHVYIYMIIIYIYQPWLTSHVPRLLQTQLPHERSESNLLLVSSKDPRNTFRQTTTSGTWWSLYC